jgi:hypothetical protein
MEKKEKSATEKSLLKQKQMNQNMFKFIQTVPNVQVLMPAVNLPDPQHPDQYIPQYEINGKSTTNQEFDFKITIDELDDYSVHFIINETVDFKLHNNSQLRFVLENYQVTVNKKKTAK